jgi:beta-galactosidase
MIRTRSVAICIAVVASVSSATLYLAAQEKPGKLVFPFGAVYFRKSNPPEQDWERDHKTAAAMGVNIFRHWFMWASIETSPGRYDWRDYDRMVDLERQNNIKVVIAEITNGAPEWMWDKYPQARQIDRDGAVNYPSVSGSSATGSAPLCLDNEVVRTQAEKFLTALVERYRDNPALLGYDVWNEGSVQECHCDATQAKFREWLKAKYGSIEALQRAWHRYSLPDWDAVHPPHDNSGYADSLDWAAFRRDDAIRLLHWRVELIRRLDRKNAITAHGSMNGFPSEIWWRHAAAVDSYGYTWVSTRHSGAPWMQFQIIDLVRGASRGKPFWHAEAEGGQLWLQPQVLNRPLEDGRSLDDKDVRLLMLVDMAAGATGFLFTRWRPLLNGPLFGAFGPMGMDGSATPQADMGSKLGRWANAHEEIWRSRPVKGDVAIVYVPESQDFSAVQSGSPRNYNESVQGAYQAFFDSNIQPDFVSIDDIGEYPLVYLPYPVMLKKATADKLRDYVRKGGKLVSEGLPGYFGDAATVGTIQPNLGLDEVFGARESYVQFTPDLLEKLSLSVNGKTIGGRYFLQEYRLSGGQEAGRYANGHVAAVDSSFGSGRAFLVGTFPGSSYYLNHLNATREFFASLLSWANIRQQVQSSDTAIQARVHQGAGGTYLWIVNPTRTSRTVTITLSAAYQKATELWQQSSNATVTGNRVSASVEERNAAVIRLE